MILDTSPIRIEVARFQKKLDLYQKVVWIDYKTTTDKDKQVAEELLLRAAKELSISLSKMADQR